MMSSRLAELRARSHKVLILSVQAPSIKQFQFQPKMESQESARTCNVIVILFSSKSKCCFMLSY